MEQKNKVLLLGYLISSVGDWAFKFSLPLYLYERTGSSTTMALSYALTFLPLLFVSIPGALIGDRMDKKVLLIILDTLGIFISLWLYWVMQQNLPLMWLYVSVFLISSLLTTHRTIFQSFLPCTFARKNLPTVNATVYATDNVLSAFGPLIGIGFSIFMGYSSAALLNAVSYLFSVIALLFVVPHTMEIVRESAYKMLKEGIYITRHNSFVWIGSIMFFMTNFGLHLLLAIFVFHLKSELQLTDLEVGLIYAVSGGFSAIGALVGRHVSQNYDCYRAMPLAVILVGVALIPLAFAQNIWSISLTYGSMTFLWTMNIVVYFTQIQRSVPLSALSRVLGISKFIVFILIPVGAITGGFLIDYYSFSTIVIGASIYRISVGLWAYWRLGKSSTRAEEIGALANQTN